MLAREDKCFDLQRVWIAQQAVGADADRMICQLNTQSGTQSPEGTHVIDLDVELPRQLIVDRLADLTGGVAGSANSTWQRHRGDAVVSPQLGHFFETWDIEHFHPSVLSPAPAREGTLSTGRG